MDYCSIIEIRDSQPRVIQNKGRECRVFFLLKACLLKMRSKYFNYTFDYTHNSSFTFKKELQVRAWEFNYSNESMCQER